MDPGVRTLAGRYRLDGVIGRGGMSTVYRATDTVLGRTVAIKVLLAELADEDPSYVERFQREARSAAVLANSSVVTVYDTGVDDDIRFIVMEYVTGHSLAALLRERKPLPVEQAVRVAERVAAALAAAHAAGILHRDIKPANVMIAEDGTVKVLDFGIARKLDSTTLTQAASVVGTAAYMSPERALGNAGDARSDIYSLGCLLYAMLTGAPPFAGEVAAVILHEQINSEPRPPSELRKAVPMTLDLLVLSMLAKAPEERPRTAAEVRDQLAALSGPGGRRSPARAAVVAPPSAPTASPDRTAVTRLLTAPRRWDHRRRAVVMAIATGALALAAIAIGSSGGGSSHRARSTGSPRIPTLSVPASTQTTATAAPVTTTSAQTQPAGPVGGPPGHGGKPPGKAKKHHGGDGGD